MRVFINPGHDRDLDPGAICPDDYSFREADVAWNVGELLQKHLENAGIEVIALCQNDDLWTVCNLANKKNADVFISIHCNSFGSRQANGTETFCYGSGTKGELLAGCIQRQIVDAIMTLNRGVKYNSEFYVLRKTAMPAVLVELGFISNEWDAIQLRYRQDDFAKAIARGVTDYQRILEANNE